MLDSIVSFLWADSAGNEVLADADGSQASSFVAAFKPLRFTDGWGIATPTSDADFAGMCRTFGVEGADDPRVATIGERNRHRELSRDLMKQCYDVASGWTTAQAMERLEAERVPCGVILSPAELVDDPQARAMRLFIESDHPIAGRVRLPRHAAQFGGTPAEHGVPAPGLGQHSDEILIELGMGDRISELRAAGTVV